MNNKYSNLSKEDLVKLVEKLESRKKYGLIWDEDKVKEQFEKDAENALPVLKEVKGKEINDEDDSKPVNILIEGDNYHALSVLNFTHQGKVDVIYIDPPYNTGSNDFKFNDKYVDRDDIFRHSKWLSFMSKRLRLAKNLLNDKGLILISIDDIELYPLKMLCDEVFGVHNWLQTFVWNTEGNIDNQKKIKSNHEYILAYAKNESLFVAPHIIDPNIGQESKLYNDTIENSIIKNGPKNPISSITLPKGFPASVKDEEINKRHKGWPLIHNNISIRDFAITNDVVVESGWSSRDLLLDFINNKFEPIKDSKGQDTWFKITNTGAIYVYKGRSKDQSHVLSVLNNFGTTKKTSEYLKKMGINFNYPKPVDLIQYLLQMHNSKNAVILDFFAGTGTTGHAVLDLNRKDKNSFRSFILCTDNENNICTDICYPRIKNIINGHESLEAASGSLKYFKTKFIKKTANKDDLKIRITKECTEMLCLREGIFNEIQTTDDYRIFQKGNKVLAAYYSLDRKALFELKKELNKLEGDKTFYCFTLDPLGLNKKDFSGWKDVTVEPIPQKILDVYKQIYEY